MTLICDSCKPGYYGNQCESSCQNCAQGTCAQFTGTCDVRCVDGFYTDTCTKSCLHPGCSSCDRQSGQCVTCKTGLYGTSCDLNCSAQCLPSNTGIISCNKTNGACLMAACKPGYYGNACVTRCPVNCLPNANDNLVRCDFTSGICTEGCIDGRFGAMCERQCNHTCAGSAKRCQRDGECTEGCVNGFYGDYCQNACMETCTDDKCDRKSGVCADCLQDRTPLCRDAVCPTSTTGLYCNQTCPQNCLNGVCNRYTARCEACANDWWGANCTTPCGNCKGDKCNQDNGACASGCDDGYYSLTCTTPCMYSGCQACDNLGECVSCKQGKYRSLCSLNCDKCFPRAADARVYCEREFGVCSEGQCVPGYFRSTCTERCNGNCGMNSLAIRSCNIDTGRCTEECELTWFGPSCDISCPVNCANYGIILKMLNDLGANLSIDEIDRTHRLGPRKQVGSKPRDIIIKFVSYRARQKLYNVRTSAKTIDPYKKVYVNEALTRYRSEMFYDARKLASDKLVEGAWTHDGQVLVRDLKRVIHRIDKPEQITELRAKSRSNASVAASK